MPTWLIYLPTIISTVIELVKLLKELNRDEIKETKDALKSIRKNGDADSMRQLCAKLEHNKCAN
jgi:hypothetical protein